MNRGVREAIEEATRMALMKGKGGCGESGGGRGAGVAGAIKGCVVM